MFSWPAELARVPDDDWVTSPIETLALKYDTVENHGWYRNLEPTIDELASYLRDGHRVIDYSGGTGILLDKLLGRLPNLEAGFVLVDASPKFLRLALEKLRSDARVAFRLIRYLREKARLELLDEVLPSSMIGTFDAVSSTNAIHLYYELDDTLRSWARALRPGGRAFIQSGNIRNPEAAAGTWIIDETVEHVHSAALGIVESDARYAAFRTPPDPARTKSYDDLRRKFFLPVRPLSHYIEALQRTGFEVVSVRAQPILARVDEWYQFLSAYHEGVLGWAGGSRRIDGNDPDEATVSLRLSLLRDALDRVFEGRSEFTASWTYLTCRTR